MLGPRVDEIWRDLDLGRHEVTALVVGKHREEGSGAAVLGDPRMALIWLVNELSALGIELVADQVVTTGTCTVPLPFAPGERVKADFGRPGQVDLSIES